MIGNKKSTSNKKNVFFYLTLVYIISFLIWWTYLLYNKTEIYYENKINVELWKSASFEDSTHHRDLLKKYEREKIMIITEGSVFFIILLVMIFRIKKAIEQEIEFSKQQQNFILSITHELKSPISSIKLMGQTLTKHNLNEEQKNKLLKNTLNEVDRLQNLVENVLLAAKIDNDAYGFSKSEVDFSELLESILKKFKTAQDANIVYEIEKEVNIQADISGLTSIIVNLVENALKYSLSGSNVVVKLFTKENAIYFVVKDEGIGIDDIEKVKIFDKFYRIGCEETRATKGTGLGLYIVKELVEFHNGNISVQNNTPKGTIFEVVFEV